MQGWELCSGDGGLLSPGVKPWVCHSGAVTAVPEGTSGHGLAARLAWVHW